jgi:hypothetical protein
MDSVLCNYAETNTIGIVIDYADQKIKTFGITFIIYSVQ